MTRATRLIITYWQVNKGQVAFLERNKNEKQKNCNDTLEEYGEELLDYNLILSLM